MGVLVETNVTDVMLTTNDAALPQTSRGPKALLQETMFDHGSNEWFLLKNSSVFIKTKNSIKVLNLTYEYFISTVRQTNYAPLIRLVTCEMNGYAQNFWLCLIIIIIKF